MFGDYGHAGDPSQTGRLRVARYVLREAAKVKLGLPRPPAPALAPPRLGRCHGIKGLPAA